MKYVRIGQMFTALGGILIIISFLGAPPVGESMMLSDGSYRGFMFKAITNIIVEAKAVQENASFSFYIFDAENTREFVLNGTLNEAKPLVEFSELHEFADTVEIPRPGLYSIFLSTQSEENIEISISVRSGVPHVKITLFGAILTLLGSTLILAPKLQKKLKNISSNKTRPDKSGCHNTVMEN